MGTEVTALGARDQSRAERGKIVVGDEVAELRSGHGVEPGSIQTVDQEQQAPGPLWRKASPVQRPELRPPIHARWVNEEDSANSSSNEFSGRDELADPSGCHAQSSSRFWH